MKKLTVLLGLSLILFSSTALAQVSEGELKALRDQIELLNQRLDQLEQQNQQLAKQAKENQTQAVAQVEKTVDEKIDAAISEKVDEKVAKVSWAEKIKWTGDFRYRYEHIDQEGKDSRNRSRIRARPAMQATLSPTLKVGFGLATGGDDPVSSNQTIGGGGSSKDIKLDLAYFDWAGLENTRFIGGKYKNFLIRPGKKGLRWDGDWRPEGLGLIWDNGKFFAQGLGTWLVGDSKLGTEFAWGLQAGMKFKIGETGKLKFGAGYTVFDIAGRTPLFGDPDDFYGNSFVYNPASDLLEFKYDYKNIEAFAEYGFKLSGGLPVSLFGNYTVNDDADENDTGYLAGIKLGSAKKKGTWDVTYFYEKLEADSTVGLLSDSDFGGGGTDSKGHVISAAYAFHDKWNFKATYFINKVNLSSGDPADYDRLMLDLGFKY